MLHRVSLCGPHKVEQNRIQSLQCLCVFVLLLVPYIHRNCGTDPLREDPAQDTGEANRMWDCSLMFCPPRVPGTGGDGLEDTQGARVVNGHTSGLSVKLESESASKIIEKVFQIKSCQVSEMPLKE